MIGGATLAPAPRSHARRPRRRRWWLLVVAVLLAITSGFAVTRGLRYANPVASPIGTTAPVMEATTTPPPMLEATTAPTPSPSFGAPIGGAEHTPPLLLPGEPPAKGEGTFSYSQERGRILGTKGPVRRFKVAVEKGSNEEPEEFAAGVEHTLGDRRSWIGGEQFRLQLVPGAAAADFTVYLATRETAYRMCMRVGTDIRVEGTPYTSCRTPGKAIINLDRWRLSAPPFLAARVPLLTYRQYVVNHEVGHEFGHGHEGCPVAGGPAPVMVQQTLTLRGCKPNAWPRLGSAFVTGPPI